MVVRVEPPHPRERMMITYEPFNCYRNLVFGVRKEESLKVAAAEELSREG